MPGLSGYGTSTPGLSALGPSSPVSSESGPSTFGSSIFNIVIEEVLNKFSQCHSHQLQVANIFSP